MNSAPDGFSELFAAKGRALPACSERLEKRSVPPPPRDGEPGPAAAPHPDQEAPQDSQDDGPASVLSIDLRRVLVPAAQQAPAPDGPSPSQTQVPPSQPQGHAGAGPFVAAMVAIAIAGGVFFLLNTERLSVTRVADEPAAADTASAPAEDRAEDEDLRAAASREPQAPSEAPPEAEGPTVQDAASEEEDQGSEGGSLPSFDLVRVEPDGSAVIAGRAAPYAELVLLHNGEPIGTVTADWAGEWAFVTDRPLPADRHEITLLVNEPDAEVTLPQGAEPSSRVSDLGGMPPR